MARLVVYYDGSVVINVNCNQATLGAALNSLIGQSTGYFGIVGATGGAFGTVTMTEWALSVNTDRGQSCGQRTNVQTAAGIDGSLSSWQFSSTYWTTTTTFSNTANDVRTRWFLADCACT